MKTESSITVRYAETDKMGIVHHSAYPIWFEIGRTDFIKQAGMPYSVMEEKGIMTPLTELNCKYYLPAYYEDELTVETRVRRALYLNTASNGIATASCSRWAARSTAL